MALGDLTTVELQKALTTTATDSQITNAGASYETKVTSIFLTFAEGATTKRNICMYKNGTAASNKIGCFDIDPTGNNAPKCIVLSDPRITLTGTQTLLFKQDTGTDINIYVNAVQETIV